MGYLPVCLRSDVALVVAAGHNRWMRRVLTADHEIPRRAPLTIEPGEVVQVGDQDTEWPAFVFITNAHGSGWVPARLIDTEGATGIVRAPYDTTELPASKGECVDVIRDDAESGWSWCRNVEGREGWVPNRVLRGL